MNRLSLGNVVRTVTCLAALTMFISCEKDNDSPLDSFIESLTGNIEGECAIWDSVGISFNALDIVQTAPIIDKKFTFLSLSTPQPEYLEAIIESEDTPNIAEISNREARICTLTVFALRYEEYTRFGRGIVQRIATSSSTTQIMYFYADRDVRVTGSGFGAEWGDIKWGLASTTDVDINLKQGWNIVLLITSFSKDSIVTKIRNDNSPSSVIWKSIFDW